MSANDTDVIRGDSAVGILNGRPWTSREIAQLEHMNQAGAAAIAAALGRSVKSVQRQAERRGISLRTPGRRDGRLLGFPNGTAGLLTSAQRVAKLRDLRERALAGETDPALLLARARWIAKGKPLCPKCAMRPAEERVTGFCKECHLRLMFEVDAVTEVREAQRENDVWRQRKHREKVKEA